MSRSVFQYSPLFEWKFLQHHFRHWHRVKNWTIFQLVLLVLSTGFIVYTLLDFIHSASFQDNSSGEKDGVAVVFKSCFKNQIINKVYCDSEPDALWARHMGQFAMRCTLSCTPRARIAYIFVWVQQRPLLVFCFWR